MSFKIYREKENKKEKIYKEKWQLGTNINKSAIRVGNLTSQ